MQEIKDKKAQIVMSVLVIIIMIIIAVISTLFKSKEIPFKVSSIYITSTANAKYADDNNTENWNLKLFQNNDIFLNINLIDNFEKVNKKNARIKEIYLDNFKFENGPFLGTSIDLYKLSSNKDKLFEYKDEYIFSDKLIYTVVEENANEYDKEINKNGGQIALSIVNNNLKELEIENEQEIYFDGTLLGKGEITQDEVSFDVSFDVVLVTENDNMYVSNIKLKLPCGNIIEEGFSLNKEVDVTNMQFVNVK